MTIAFSSRGLNSATMLLTIGFVLQNAWAAGQIDCPKEKMALFFRFAMWHTGRLAKPPQPKAPLKDAGPRSSDSSYKNAEPDKMALFFRVAG